MGSPLKLGQQHTLFMTQLQTSPSKSNDTGNNNMNNDGDNTLDRTGMELNVPNSNSSKVIDSLRNEIDALTKTNLELTKQSHNLLNKLEVVQVNETKLIENLNNLKSLNGTINDDLIDSTDKLKYLESKLNQLKLDYSKEIELKMKLEEKIKLLKINGNRIPNENELLMKQVQYDVFLSNQEDYKKFYTNKIDELNELLTRFKLNYESKKDDNDNIIADTFNEMENLTNQYYTLDNNIKEYIQEDKIASLVNEKFDINDWIQLYKNMNEKFNYYANERMELSDDTINKLKHELRNSNNSNSNSNNNNNSQSTRMRNFSGSNISKDRRTTKYYGNLRAFSLEALNSSINSTINNSNNTNNNESEVTDISRIPSGSSMSMLLPGVKRTSSIRKNPSINVRHNK